MKKMQDIISYSYMERKERAKQSDEEKRKRRHYRFFQVVYTVTALAGVIQMASAFKYHSTLTMLTGFIVLNFSVVEYFFATKFAKL